ncbi:MAG: DUF1850 domain-containing protein [Sulfuritalea sp.]|nr:DUF1850 domain-containing protein [Sulfuritalea sp.]
MICLAAGTLAASIAVNSFTLVWMHSIEKTRWEEDWRVEGKMLVLDEARILSTGAGMDLPPDAVLKDGIWHYRPVLAPQNAVRLTHSPYTSGYELCSAGSCRPLADHLPGIENTVVIELRECSQ